MTRQRLATPTARTSLLAPAIPIAAESGGIGCIDAITRRRACGAAAAMAAVFTVTSVAAAGPPAAPGAVQDHAALAGSWVLNADLSDEPRPRPPGRADDDDRRGRGGVGAPDRGGSGGRGGGRFGRRGGRFGGGDPQQMARMRANMQEAMQDLLAAARRMTIVAGPDEIVLTYDDGRVVRLIPDGREHAGLAGTSAQVTRRTRWHGATLEAEIELQSRAAMRVQQTYEVQRSDGQRQLIVTTRVSGGRRGAEREFRRVYDADAEQP